MKVIFRSHLEANFINDQLKNLTLFGTKKLDNYLAIKKENKK